MVPVPADQRRRTTCSTPHPGRGSDSRAAPRRLVPATRAARTGDCCPSAFTSSIAIGNRGSSFSTARRSPDRPMGRPADFLRRTDARARRRLHARPARTPDDAARRDPDAGLHAGWHERHGQGARSRRPRRGRRPDHPVQHLPPVPAARPRAHRAARRPAQVHGLEAADPDRLRRLPGGQPGRLPLRRRRGRDLPLAPRWLDPPLHTGALDRRPGGTRLRHCRRASTSPSRRIRIGRREVAEAMVRTHAWAERCLAAHQRPDQALFGIIQGGLEPDLRAESTQRHRRRCRSTASA